MLAFITERKLEKTVHVAQIHATGCSSAREPIEFAKNSLSPEIGFELKSRETSFLEF